MVRIVARGKFVEIFDRDGEALLMKLELASILVVPVGTKITEPIRNALVNFNIEISDDGDVRVFRADKEMEITRKNAQTLGLQYEPSDIP